MKGVSPFILYGNRFVAQCQSVMEVLLYVLLAISITLSVISIYLSLKNRR